MGVKLVSSSGGSVEINPPTTASNFTATMPAGTGVVSVNGVSSNIVSGTAVASTSGTSIDFTGIPSWVKRITVMFSGVSTSGTSNVLVRLGAGSVQTTGYDSTTSVGSTAGTFQSTTAGFFAYYQGQGASSVLKGIVVLTNISGNSWVQSGSVSDSVFALLNASSSGSVTLSGTLDRVRITTVNGTDTFDAGSINILYE